MNPRTANSPWSIRFGRGFDDHPRQILGLVLGVGFLLRLRAAWGTFLNPDEALHFLAGNGSSLLAAYQASLDTAHPPLLFLILHLWRNLGTSAFVLRLPSVIAGSVFCWVLFHWLSRIFGPAPGWIGLLLATFLPPMIELSAEIRQYALLLCFLMIAAYLFERALSADSASLMVLSFFFLYLALLSHFSGILFAGALGGYGLLRLTSHRFSGRVIAAWVAGQAAALGLFVFLYQTHISQLQGSGSEQRAINQVFPNSYFHWGHGHWLLFIFARTFGVCQFVFGQLAVGDLAGLAFLTGVAILLRAQSPTEPGRPTGRQLGIFFLLPFAINCALRDCGPLSLRGDAPLVISRAFCHGRRELHAGQTDGRANRPRGCIRPGDRCRLPVVRRSPSPLHAAQRPEHGEHGQRDRFDWPGGFTRRPDLCRFSNLLLDPQLSLPGNRHFV